MTTRYFGAPIKRNEDPRLLRGRALFVDDIEFPNMLHAAFLRSAVAHGRIRDIDVSAARARPGVVAVYTAADLGDYWQPGPLLVPPPRSRELRSTSAPRCRSPRTRCATSANRWRWS